MDLIYAEIKDERIKFQGKDEFGRIYTARGRIINPQVSLDCSSDSYIDCISGRLIREKQGIISFGGNLVPNKDKHLIEIEVSEVKKEKSISPKKQKQRGKKSKCKGEKNNVRRKKNKRSSAGNSTGS